MLPSIASPLASLASGGGGLATPLLGAVAPRSLLGGGASGLATALAVADSVLDAADKLGLLAAAKGKVKASGAGYALAAAASAAASSAKSSSKTSGTAAKKTTSAPKASSTAKKAGPLAFLEDSKLSVEDKLMRLLAYLNDKWEKDLQKKMKELGASQGATSSSSSTGSSTAKKKSSGGLLGGLGGVVKAATAFFPAAGVALEVLKEPAAREVLGKVGGPALAAGATALGFPQLAPLALQYGPQLVDLAAGVATSVGSAPAATSATKSSGAAATKPDGAGLSSDKDAQLKLMEIQRIMEQQKEMFALVSNILRASHDGRMAVIQNVR